MTISGARWLLFASLALSACTDVMSTPDASTDSGVTVPVDAGSLEDAGAREDAGVISDAGSPLEDAGMISDAGSPQEDAGVISDAGSPLEDAGVITDAGAPPEDAGVSIDAGIADAGMSCGQIGPASITTNNGTSLLLRGMVVTPTQFLQGEVRVEGDTITCVASSCGDAGTIVETRGIIFPGLINAHDHVLFDIFDVSDWAPTQVYANHNQWASDARYQAMNDAKQYLNGEGSPVDIGCEMLKYAEIRALLSGTTSVAGHANPANKACYGTLARTIDQTPNGLPADRVQVATTMPNATAATTACQNFTNGSTNAYLVHVGEGVDVTSRNEFATLGGLASGCLLAPQTSIVHGTALSGTEFDTMATNGMGLVWSPRSNVHLYGGGTDLTRTTNVPLARMKGINVALATDWTVSGSENLLDELRFANQVDDTVWGNTLSA